MRWQHEADNVASSAGAGPGTLASDADRDTVVGLLSEAFAEGRLIADEHGERARAAYAARTWAELAQLIADLPIPADSAAGRPAAIPGGVDQCLLCALLVLCPPAGIAWLLAARRRSRPERGQPLALGQAAARPGSPPNGGPETGCGSALAQRARYRDPVPTLAGGRRYPVRMA